MSWTIGISIKNMTAQRQTVRIRKGQVFENKRIGSGLQNVAAIRDYVVQVAANANMIVDVEVLCINKRLEPPAGFLNATGFYINRDFDDQQNLWSAMRP